MLLHVRNPYYSAIRDGLKTFEVRAGSRYARLDVGDTLSINGQFTVRVVRRETFATCDLLVCALATSAYPLTREAVDACYPGIDGPYFVFWFDPPAVSTASARTSARQLDCPPR
jgi:hypothetical protein